MMLASLMFQAAALHVDELSAAWEIAKGLMLALGAAGAFGVFRMRDDIREIKQELFGRDGTNGMRSQLKLATQTLENIDRRHIAEDAEERARESYEGDERRHAARRVTDPPPAQERSA